MLRINFVTYKKCLYKECHGTKSTLAGRNLVKLLLTFCSKLLIASIAQPILALDSLGDQFRALLLLKKMDNYVYYTDKFSHSDSNQKIPTMTR